MREDEAVIAGISQGFLLRRDSAQQTNGNSGL
jgi:hypothetical protein